MATVLALTPAQMGGEVKVYFSKGYGIPGKAVAVTRKAPDRGVARYTIEQLIAGPTKAERAKGLRSELTGRLHGESDCGGDFKLKIERGTATLRFCRMVWGSGVGGDARALHTIETTLKQFRSVKKVISLNQDGRCLFDMTDNGTSCLTGHE
ncbi:GerMN domain-containing protein [Nonomuraea rhizosphaerae]|uniref:GerMN domain-containing protein n=1 Tax=Nonomuraea rhizosphaerae TaxID=2665663 RepID=UPI001C5D8290|nr:GerMN domain-containing protein [Nonomuraea rhizosphaerae]